MLEASVIIPLYNEANYVLGLLKSLNKQTVNPERVEFLFVDGASTDNTVDLLNKADFRFNQRILHNPKRIVPVSMNLAIAEARGERIVRLDAHSSFAPNYIELLLDYSQKNRVVNVGTCWKTEPTKSNAKSVSISKVLSSKFGVGNSAFRIGSDTPMETDTVPFGCFLKKDLIAVGGYNERLVRNQDIELNSRLSNLGPIHLLPEELIVYHSRTTFSDLARNNLGNGKWNVLTIYITGNWNSLSIRHFIPLIFVLSLISPLLLAILDWRWALSSAFVLFSYLFVISILSLRMLGKGSRWYFLVFSFITLHFSYGWGSLIGLVQLPFLYFRDK